MLVIGVTGGSGCGKTEFIGRIAARGGEVINCDALYAQMVQTDESLRNDLTKAFGAVFRADGQLDRPKLAKTVFSDPAQLAKLNEIVFFHIGRAVSEQCRKSRASLFAIDAINLLESGLASLCACTVAVTAPEEARLERIMRRDGISREAALLRIRAQKPNAYYRSLCTYVLENLSTCEEFIRKAEDLLNTITKEYLP